MIDPRFFTKNKAVSLGDLCAALNLDVLSSVDFTVLIEDVGSIREAGPKHLTFFHNPKYIEDLTYTKAGFCLIHEKFAKNLPQHTVPLICGHPYRAFGAAASIFYHKTQLHEDISSSAHIHPSAKIGKNCQIAAYVVIEENVEIGDGCCLYPFSHIQHGVKLGNHCIIENHCSVGYAIMGDKVHVKPGARIGQSGFGFHMDERGHFDVPQLGRVIIGNDVQIGANTTIDRGSQYDTTIGNGVRIDNLVQIAHNVEVGDHSVLVAQVGIAGSTKLGKFVIAAGQVGIAGHIHIGDGVKIAAQSGLMRDVPSGQTVGGSPAMPIQDWHRQTIALKRLIKK